MKELYSGIYKYQTESAIFDLSDSAPTQMTSTENAVCHLRILQNRTVTIVIVTELATNPGMSITNAAEVLASKIVNQFHLNPQTTRFIEHYGQESYDTKEERERADTYDEVAFSWQEHTATHPVWKPVETKEMQKLIKKSST